MALSIDAHTRNLVVIQQYLYLQMVIHDNNDKVVQVIKKRRIRRKIRKRRCWVRPWLDVGRRVTYGHFTA